MTHVFYKCVQLVQGVIMLISITSSFFLILKKTSRTSFCFFGTSKSVFPQCLLFTLFCFREKNGEKKLTINLNKFCLHAVVGLATHCANRLSALLPRAPENQCLKYYNATISKYIKLIFCYVM